jgi:hypothetical protein
MLSSCNGYEPKNCFRHSQSKWVIWSELLRRGKIDPFWSKEIKRVVEIRGDIVFLEDDDRGYHARQVKVVPSTKAPSETEAPGPEVEEAADSDESQSTSESDLRPDGNHTEQATTRLDRPSNSRVEVKPRRDERSRGARGGSGGSLVAETS